MSAIENEFEPAEELEDDEDEMGELDADDLAAIEKLDELFPEYADDAAEEDEEPADEEPAVEVDSRECALIAARAADSKKASDLMVQEVRDLIGVTDYFVIATAANNRQVNAIVDEIEEQLRKQAHVKPYHREGTQDGTWALLDYGNIVVHVFQPETREYYRLEALWNDAPVIDLAAEGLTDIPYSDRIAKMLGKD